METVFEGWQAADVLIDIAAPASAMGDEAPCADAASPVAGKQAAEKILQATRKTPTPIYFINQDTDCKMPDGLSERCVALACATGFKGQFARILYTGEVALIGTGTGRDPFCAGLAAEKLPQGQYQIVDFAGLTPDLVYLAFALGGYQFTLYKAAKPRARLLIPDDAAGRAAILTARAIFTARDLINIPANDMTPATLEAACRALAQCYGADIAVTSGAALLAQNFPLIHAVGRAADIAPRLIDIRWGKSDAPAITLVGKGITFDSGGLNIKSGSGMLLMKKDMGGAAHIMALAAMIMGRGLDIRLRVLIPAAENAIAGNAFRPGDILNSRKGMSVEITNTDAEGRLVLADALALASEEPPEALFSFATLTGAARVALGPDIAPLYATDAAMGQNLCEIGAERHDPIWQMPFWPGYEDWLSSNIADINHAPSGGFAGSIIAALFLKRFVSDRIPYNHFDIYAWAPKSRPGHPKGGDVFAIRAVFEALLRKYGSSG